MTARFRDLDKVLHELQRLLGQVDAVLRIAVFEHTRQARHGAADGPARLALHKPGFSRPERGDCAPVGNGGFALLTQGSRCGGFFQQIGRGYENYLDFEIHFQL